MDQATKRIEELKKQGVNMNIYWTFGRYDAIAVTEAANEKDAMKTPRRPYPVCSGQRPYSALWS